MDKTAVNKGKVKIIPLEAIDTLTQNGSDKVVLVGGCFDVLHYGHLMFLQKASEQGTRLIVAVESDDFIFRNKKRKPYHNQEQRAQMLAALEVVDLVIPLPDMKTNNDYLRLVSLIKPQVIAVTAGDPHVDLKKMHAESVGASVEVVTPLLTPYSTSDILKYGTVFGN